MSAKQETLSVDLPIGTVLWVRYPDLEYNRNMNQQHRIKIVPDPKNGTFTLNFLVVTITNGAEHEEIKTSLVFQDRQELVDFGNNFLGMFKINNLL